MKIVFDTPVVLDLQLDREPHVDAVSKLFSLVDTGRIDGLLCATTVTTVYYIAAKGLGQKSARALMADLLDLFGIAPVDGYGLAGALDLGFSDFEDAVLHEAARSAGAGIVTRDRTGFVKADLAVYEPQELVAAVIASQE